MRLAFTLVLDQPEEWLTDNKRYHWTRRNYLTDYWRQMARLKVRSVWRRKPPIQRARVLCTYHWPTRHRRDPANWNLTSKALVDGLVDAGVFPDDNMNHIIGPDNRGAHGARKVVVQVFEIDEPQEEK